MFILGETLRWPSVVQRGRFPRQEPRRAAARRARAAVQQRGPAGGGDVRTVARAARRQ